MNKYCNCYISEYDVKIPCDIHTRWSKVNTITGFIFGMVLGAFAIFFVKDIV